MSGGGGTNYSTGTNYTSQMPEWVRTPHQELIKWATEAARLRPFPTYEAIGEDGVTTYAIPRIAQFDPLQVSAFQGRQNLYERGDPESAMAWGKFADAGNVLSDLDYDYGYADDGDAYSPFLDSQSGPSWSDQSKFSGFSNNDFNLGAMGSDVTGYQSQFDYTPGALNRTDYETIYGFQAPTASYAPLDQAPSSTLGAYKYFLPSGAEGTTENFGNLDYGITDPSVTLSALTDEELPSWADTRVAGDNLFTLADNVDIQSALDNLIQGRDVGTPLTAQDLYAPSDFSGISDDFRLDDPSFNFAGRQGVSDYGIGTSSSGYTAPTSGYDFGSFDVSARDENGNLITDESGRTQFGGDTYNSYIQSYMDSHEDYIQQLEDELEGQFDLEMMENEAQSVASGSRGGYRESLRKGTMEAELQEAKADLRSREMAKAYDFAAQQFERDRRSGITAAQMTGDAERSEEQLRQSAFDQEMRGRMFEEQMGAQEREFGSRFGFDAASQDVQNAIQLQQMSNQANLALADLDMQADIAMQQGDFRQLELINQDRQYYSNLASQYDFKESDYDMMSTQMQQDSRVAAAENELRSSMALADSEFQQAQLGAQERQFLADLNRQYESDEARLGLEAAGIFESSKQAAADADLRADIAGLESNMQGAQLGIQERQYLADLQKAMAFQQMEYELRSDQMADDSAFRSGQLDMAQRDAANQARMQASGEYQDVGRLASDLGTQYDARQLNRLREMERAGATRRELDQAVLDMNYENYMRRTNWAQDQLNWLQGILAGAPAAQQTYTTAPGPSPVSELLGLGLAAGSVGNLFGGGDSP